MKKETLNKVFYIGLILVVFGLFYGGFGGGIFILIGSSLLTYYGWKYLTKFKKSKVKK